MKARRTGLSKRDLCVHESPAGTSDFIGSAEAAALAYGDPCAEEPVAAEAWVKSENEGRRESGVVANVRNEKAGVGCSEFTPEGSVLQLNDGESTAVFSAEGKPRLSPKTGDSGRADIGSEVS